MSHASRTYIARSKHSLREAFVCLADAELMAIEGNDQELRSRIGRVIKEVKEMRDSISAKFDPQSEG
jgi:hypothetical protein